MSQHMLSITRRKPLAIAGMLQDDGCWTTQSIHRECDLIGRAFDFIVWLSPPSADERRRAHFALATRKGKMHWQCEEPK